MNGSELGFLTSCVAGCRQTSARSALAKIMGLGRKPKEWETPPPAKRTGKKVAARLISRGSFWSAAAIGMVGDYQIEFTVCSEPVAA